MHRKQDNLACQSILDRSVPEYKSIIYKSVGSTIVFSMNMALKCIITKILLFPPCQGPYQHKSIIILYKSVGSTIVFSMDMALKCIITKILLFPPCQGPYQQQEAELKPTSGYKHGQGWSEGWPALQSLGGGRQEGPPANCHRSVAGAPWRSRIEYRCGCKVWQQPEVFKPALPSAPPQADPFSRHPQGPGPEAVGD